MTIRVAASRCGWRRPAPRRSSWRACLRTPVSCDRIVWSGDSRRVAFVIAEAIVQVYEAETTRQAFAGFIGRRSWDVPPRYVLRDLSLSHDGSRATFRECERTWRPVEPARQNRPGTRVEATIGNCSVDPTTVAFDGVATANLW